MRTIKVDKSFNFVFDACTKALEKIGIDYKADKKNKIISGSKGISIFSWGEDIQITFEEGSTILIKIESISTAQLLDWWKNSTNEEQIANAIQEQINKK